MKHSPPKPAKPWDGKTKPARPWPGRARFTAEDDRRALDRISDYAKSLRTPNGGDRKQED